MICPYMEEVSDYDTGSDNVCGLWWKKTGQDKKPYYERDRLYCHNSDASNCKMFLRAKAGEQE